MSAICDECARRLGYRQKDKVVGVWVDECDICGKRKPCTDSVHDYYPPKREGGAK